MIFTWDISPILFELGSLQIRYYGLFFATGLMLTSYFTGKFFERDGIHEEHLNRLLMWVVVGLLVGAHWTHILFYETSSIWENPYRIIQFGTGLASHGGIAGSVLAIYLYSRKYNISIYRMMDPISAAAVILGPTIRVGNFFNSEIIGRLTDGSWGVIFAQRGYTQPRHPSQLYEAGLALITFLFLNWFYRKYWKRLRLGGTFWLMLFLYFLQRFGVEYFKEYQTLSAAMPLTMGQLLSVPILALSGYMVFLNDETKVWPLESTEQEATAFERSGDPEGSGDPTKPEPKNPKAKQGKKGKR